MLQQTITPGKGIFYAGESITVELANIPDIPGKAVFRSNLYGAGQRRNEIIRHHETGAPFQDLDWHDIEIPGSGATRSVKLPLTDVGIFEGKCCFIPENGSPIIWCQGGNVRFKVTAASSIAGTTIYAAFVRQFGANLYKERTPAEPETLSQLEKEGYTFLPSSGTFRQLKKQLDHIFGVLNCRILQLLPIHPVPSEYGRMGRFGSPFAALDYFAVEPSLGEFDPQVSPMEQFEELVDAVHARNGRIFLDIPVNHTGWASKLQQEHPEYFVRRADGTFESPGAWGIVWEDLCKLDYSRKEVAEEMAEVFLFWCAKGVDGFRCDAGYMVPAEAWEYIVARVRNSFPDTLFLLEGLGGPMEKQEQLLRHSGLDFAYSEMFQNYSRPGIEHCLQVMTRSATRVGNLVSFSETHDNNRLASSGKTFARLRFMVCGLLSTNGAFGFANGAEFFAEEKIDVHGNAALNYGNEDNLCALISRINLLSSLHPAFTGNSILNCVTESEGEGMAVLRSDAAGNSRVLILLNLDCSSSTYVKFSADLPESGRDLFSGRTIFFDRHGSRQGLALPPGSGFAVELDRTESGDPALQQRISLMEKKAFRAFHHTENEKLPDISFTDSPWQFASEVSGLFPAPLTVWYGGKDHHRIVPVPWGDLLFITNPVPFRCRIPELGTGFISSVPMKDGSCGALMTLTPDPLPVRRTLTLLFESFEDQKCAKYKGQLCQLPRYDNFAFRTGYDRKDVLPRKLQAFGSSDTGSYALFPASWNSFSSKYEAFLAVNNDENFPVDRYCMFTGLNIYLAAEGYSGKVDSHTLVSFSPGMENSGVWHFNVPAGQGRSMKLEIGFRFAFSGNAIELTFRRPDNSGVPETTPAALILRPDVEDRINHEVTKASTGPEWQFPAAVNDLSRGFIFAPGERKLKVETDKGFWHPEREWHYMCDLPAERYYGLEDKTDRFSPGYFHVPLKENESFTLRATTGSEIIWTSPAGNASDPLVAAMRRFVVKRGNLSTVIAGYPWFLDWGRDTLIALRGLLKAPEFRERCANIIRAFAGFEKQGTIPNVLQGSNDSNRDTSDAPLYLIIGVRDYISETGDKEILNADCAGRNLSSVIGSIIDHYISGTPNGIKMDPESALIFSPSHFTWMDTNFPAGTPREGYPVEIQALWYTALKFTGREQLAQQVRRSIEKYFFPASFEGASDCLHCGSGTPASQAIPDDHIRSNALLLITMEAVEDPRLCQKIIESSARLLIPGALRSLADRKVSYPLPVRYNGRLINDPEYPYCGTYAGPENESRKKAYHNGTAWCWTFPAYCEALFCCGGTKQKERALSLLSSGAEYFEQAIPGELSEVADGSAPHAAGGCPAQAWSVTELFRVREIMQKS
ncbi:MAG: glycogen debranching enzyme N-terminal domain-containing protein [Lentisphaeria bacterium]|nr:glycogen debranching enzyme N-terminal domain-containing protein [Lentisphaeria bacterium]